MTNILTLFSTLVELKGHEGRMACTENHPARRLHIPCVSPPPRFQPCQASPPLLSCTYNTHTYAHAHTLPAISCCLLFLLPLPLAHGIWMVAGILHVMNKTQKFERVSQKRHCFTIV